MNKKILIAGGIVLILILAVAITGCTNKPQETDTYKSIQPETPPFPPDKGPEYPNPRDNRAGGFMKDIVKNLTDKGYDMSMVQAAIDKGDNLSALQLLNQFWEQHPEARPTLIIDPSRIPDQIERLKQQGTDVSLIEEAYKSGDVNKTIDLLQKASPMGPPGQRPGQPQ